MLRAAAFALLALAAATWPPVEPPQPAAATARLWLLRNDPHSFIGFELSEDRKRLFVVTTQGSKQALAGNRVGLKAVLTAYDLADPAHPIELFHEALGDVTPMAIFPRYNRLFVETQIDTKPQTQRMQIFDITKPAQPVLRGSVDIDLVPWISSDGLTLAWRTCFSDELKCLRAVDVSDPAKTREIEPAKAGLPDEVVHRPVFRGRTPFEEEIWDRLGDYALRNGGKRYELWRAPAVGEPTLIREVGDISEFSAFEGRLGPDAAFAVISRYEGVEIVSLAERPFSGDGLRETYRFVMDTLGPRLANAVEVAKNGPTDRRVLQRGAAYLENAGVARLANYGTIPRLTEAERAQIAASYALWLDAANEPMRAVPFAEVAGSPEALATTALHAVAQAQTWDDKVELSETALRAAQTVKARSGGWPKGFPDLERLRIGGQKDAHGVCDYVKAFSDAGRLGEIVINPRGADLVNDKRQTRIELVNSAHGETQWLLTVPEQSLVNFYEPDVAYQFVSAVPYGSTTYALYHFSGKAVAVSLANAGLLCVFEHEER